MKASIIDFCSSIGQDPLFTQGAGGNISWKDEDTMWIKASGTCMSEAREKDIFIPVDLRYLRLAIETGNFSVQPKILGNTDQRPSIEALMHAVMPHRVVVHLHAVEILSHLIHDNCQSDFQILLDSSIHWAMVDYYKPGAPLAAAVNQVIVRNENVDVIFLKNHGVVIGGETITQVIGLLNSLTKSLTTIPIIFNSQASSILSVPLDLFDQYSPIQDTDLHQLALNKNLFNQLHSNWALYPDHVVFLGAHAYIYETWNEFSMRNVDKNLSPELILIGDSGVFVKANFPVAKLAQLRCYYEVLIRQGSHSSIRVLTNEQIEELLNWDAEQYRIRISE